MKRSVLAACLVLATPASAIAQSGSGAWNVDAQLGVVSDYRFRGLSLSGEDPAVQAGATAAHASGFYGEVYLSTIEELGIGDDGDGAELEVTLSAGWAGAWLGLDWDAGLSAYQYPDGDDLNYVEIPVQVSRTLGGATATLGAAYAPAQTALGDEDNRYVWVGIDWAPEAWPVGFGGLIGREDGAWAPDGKTDWRVGAVMPLGRFRAGLDWVDSDAEDGALVASLFAAF